ncbi:MAG: glycoside hydrolase family 127 protein, partial [Phycisphaerales bacterium]|nr:glycoside hydrolase family 127 protein [Phycisphaerales bacterium]
MKNDVVKCKLNSIAPGNWKFGGYLGDRIDTIAANRILKEEAWNKLYPQTEEAFRRRDDDTRYPNKGKWQGEFWGKYILSVIAACRYYNSEELKRRVSEAVKGLLSTQDENGYIGTYTNSKYFKYTWNIWCRKYTLWGLLEAWELLGEDYIIDAASRFADHIISEVGPGAHSIVKTGMFAGMPSTSILTPVVKLYRITGNKKYLEFAEYILADWSKNENGPPDIFNKGL